VHGARKGTSSARRSGTLRRAESGETQCIASLQDGARRVSTRCIRRPVPCTFCPPDLAFCRAESPVISSTGQCLAGINMFRQSALKGCNPRSFDSAAPRRGGRCITVCKRSAAYGCGVHLHSKSRRDGIIPSLRGLWGEAASTPRVTPPASPAVMHLPPLRGYDGRSPLSTGRCPVLMIAGLSALRNAT
jgi:hypothetical protein